MTSIIDETLYRRKVLACWQGKNVGGTLGMPFEGDDGPMDLTFYRPVPTEPVANDDLDLQIVWASHMLSLDKPTVTPQVQADAWREHMNMSPDEYAVCKRNLTYGLDAPKLGQYDNWFTQGMGAAIRSELWACLSPGDPDRAAGFAYCDACCDHAGEGIWAEIFLVSIESLAFIESSTDALLDAALNRLPADSLVRRAVEDTRAWHKQGIEWLAARENILKKYGQANFTDVVQNLAFIVLGWLWGEGDFGRSLCIAVNCGRDTDCTGATLGSIMGIVDPDSIPTKWLEPIGSTIRLSPGLLALPRVPKTVEEFTEMVIELRDCLKDYSYDWDGSVLPTTPPSADDSPVFIPLKQCFVKQMPDAPTCQGSSCSEIELPGHWNVFKSEDFEDEVMMLGATLNLEEDREVRIGAYGTTATRSWVNGQQVTNWSGGAIVPAAHRPFPGTTGVLALKAGQHELVVALGRPADGQNAELVLQIADAKRHKWLPWALAKKRS